MSRANVLDRYPVGAVFQRLTILEHVGKNGHGSLLVLCRCECGNQATVMANNLWHGSTKSCGCLKRETAGGTTKHGHAAGGKRSRTYRSWASMIQRCTWPSHAHWMHYGGRGITVCDRWRQSFESFLQDMGERPEGRTLDRIDVDGNYEPGNCRWATQSEQVLNQRREAQ